MDKDEEFSYALKLNYNITAKYEYFNTYRQDVRGKIVNRRYIRLIYFI